MKKKTKSCANFNKTKKRKWIKREKKKDGWKKNNKMNYKLSQFG